MSVFGLISSDNSAPHDAIKAAIEMQDATEVLMKARAEQDEETFEVGIGINTGNAIVGNVGSENRMDYTVIGDSVNIAARLEQIAKCGEIINTSFPFFLALNWFFLFRRPSLPSCIKGV